MKKWKTTGKVVLKVVGISCTILVICGLLSIFIINDYTAKQVENNLWDLPLPEKTKLVDGISKAGKLSGSGNGMQYFGAILIKSELPLEDLEKYYSDYRSNEWEYIVEVQEGQAIRTIEHGVLKFTEVVGDKGYYIVYSWGKGIGLLEEIDIRGH